MTASRSDLEYHPLVCPACGESVVCEPCRSTHRTSRVRLTEASAQLVETLLRRERHSVLRERRSAINANNAGRRDEAERQLALIKFVTEEVEQVQFENRWHSISGDLYE